MPSSPLAGGLTSFASRWVDSLKTAVTRASLSFAQLTAEEAVVHDSHLTRNAVQQSKSPAGRKGSKACSKRGLGCGRSDRGTKATSPALCSRSLQ